MTRLEKLRDQEAEEHSSVYINNDIKIRAHVGFQCGWDTRDKLAQEHTANLVEALKDLSNEMQVFLNVSMKIHFPDARLAQEKARLAIADYKRMMEGEE